MAAALKPSSAPLSDAFAAAAGVIAAVIGGRNLDRELAVVPLPLRPAVQDLAYGTLRQYGRGDALLSALLAKAPAELRVRTLLLAAIYRLETRPDDAHTTVDQAVTACGTLAQGRLRALVNGVLRNFLRRHDELLATALNTDAALWQHPHWWVEKIRLAYPDSWRDILAAGNQRPPMTLRVNRRRKDGAAYLAQLADGGIGARALDGCAVLLDKPVPVIHLPGFAAGEVSVQDWGAQHAARLLDARAGMRVLDACAAPGGKAAHLLELADIDLTALDVESSRLARVADNLHRLGLAATLRVADCADLGAWWDGKPFDRILADVPCSASGVVRRHPDAKWLRRNADVAAFVRTQARILESLWQVLAPGGTMLYCTCSLFAEENRQQVEAFASHHPEARRLPTGGALNEWLLAPGAENDGFYYALLQKNA